MSVKRAVCLRECPLAESWLYLLASMLRSQASRPDLLLHDRHGRQNPWRPTIPAQHLSQQGTRDDSDILLSAASSKINHTNKVDMLNKLINHNHAFQNLARLLKQHRHFLDHFNLNPDLYSHSWVCKTTSHPSRRQNGMCFCANRPHKKNTSKHYRKSTQHAALRHTNTTPHTRALLRGEQVSTVQQLTFRWHLSHKPFCLTSWTRSFLHIE